MACLFSLTVRLAIMMSNVDPPQAAFGSVCFLINHLFLNPDFSSHFSS